MPLLARAHGGQCLPGEVQARMETLFGTRFSEVRVHVSPEVSALGASALTQGSRIYFAPGRYDPVSPAGQRLLAHELAHVVQQRTGRVRNPFGTGIAVVADPGLEAEAARMALRTVTAVRRPIVAQRSVARVPAGRAIIQPKMDRLIPIRGPGGAVIQCSWGDLLNFANRNRLTFGALAAVVAYLGATALYSYLTSETSDQENLRRRLEENDFRTSATLKHYTQHFGIDFTKKLESLGPGDRWLDAGAGQAMAIRDYYASLKGTAQTVALSHTIPTDSAGAVAELERETQKKFVYLSGKFFNEFSAQELGGSTGSRKFALITDYNGVLFYTHTLSEDLQKYLDMLENDGELYVARFGAKIGDNRDGVVNWLKAVKGIEFSETIDGAFRIRRTGQPDVPKLKYAGGDDGQAPPVRVFTTA